MKKGEHKGKPAPGDRGLYDFARILDTYGSEVTLRLSSTAGKACVWVFCENKQHANMAPHLDVRAARLLRDGLDRFIAEVENL